MRNRVVLTVVAILVVASRGQGQEGRQGGRLDGFNDLVPAPPGADTVTPTAREKLAATLDPRASAFQRIARLNAKFEEIQSESLPRYTSLPRSAFEFQTKQQIEDAQAFWNFEQREWWFTWRQDFLHRIVDPQTILAKGTNRSNISEAGTACSLELVTISMQQNALLRGKLGTDLSHLAISFDPSLKHRAAWDEVVSVDWLKPGIPVEMPFYSCWNYESTIIRYLPDPVFAARISALAGTWRFARQDFPTSDATRLWNSLSMEDVSTRLQFDFLPEASVFHF